MPIYKATNCFPDTALLLWNITETAEALSEGLHLTQRSLDRLRNFKSEAHRRGFLSVRRLLLTAGYSDSDLYYDPFGKPHLSDGKHISISHSHNFSAIIISDRITGLDLELRREKIAVIAHKFAEPSFVLDQDDPDYINKLTVNWGVKEAVFKIRNERGISFKDHIEVKSFEMSDKQTTATLRFNNLERHFDVYFEEIEQYTIVYLFERH
ncbi:4-phosphopantetheinyl transferase [Flavobacterium magnum]|uniref:4-phosphopantetheinyl transferase n=1 Tax=Flavobacterium magnum TaxID=2162713 RepID=A0A2S0RCP0_9FLAO|nr:4-phosphopantetheinyl transferase [Flavobacterium magnum]AWA29050.1 4-phosphopantetheinyl transferase [Flavobacterium magnum]